VRARWWSLKKTLELLCIYYRRVRFFVLFRVARRWSLARPTAGHGLLLLLLKENFYDGGQGGLLLFFLVWGR